MSGNRFSEQFPIPESIPSLQEWFEDPRLSEPLADPSLAPGLSYGHVAAAVYRLLYDRTTTYGQSLIELGPRYNGHFGYETRLMLADIGVDADAVGHNFNTFLHVSDTIAIEESSGALFLDPTQKTGALVSAVIHDAHEGVTGDVAYGEKTDEFRAFEANVRSDMLRKGLRHLLPLSFIAYVEAITSHRNNGPEHDCVTVGHGKSQFLASMDAGERCFWLLKHGLESLTQTTAEDPVRRFTQLARMAVCVSGTTYAELCAFKNDFSSVSDMLAENTGRFQRIQSELPPVIQALGYSADQRTY